MGEIVPKAAYDFLKNENIRLKVERDRWKAH